MSHKIHHSVRTEGEIPGGRRLALDFHWNRERLPGILLLPNSETSTPAAVLLHGLHSDKERMVEMVGVTLLRRGIASLALDLPLHGERSGDSDPTVMLTPFDMMRRWRAAQEESTVALQYLSSRPEIDSRRIALIGYSLGAFLGLKITEGNPLVRSLIVAGGGDLPDYTPFVSIVRALADPLKMVQQLRGRPFLMVHGRYDRAITPVQAERLYRAAGEPKKMIWWDCGHILPPAAIDEAAMWLAEQFGSHQKAGVAG